MRPFLIIGITTENDLFVSSIQHDLKDANDQIAAQNIIEAHMGCEVDRILIVDESQGHFAPATVVNDFNAKDQEED